MDIYTEDDFEENNNNDEANYQEDVEEENYEESDDGENKEEYSDEEFDELDESEPEQTTIGEVLANSSTQSRCTILEEELRLLKLENELLLSREKSLKDRLEVVNNDVQALDSRLLESEKGVSVLNKEINLIKCRSEARQSALESSYRDICSKMAASEEANQKLRFDLNQQKAKNSVLEELVENKNLAIAELERRMEHLPAYPNLTFNHNGFHQSDDKVKDLKLRLRATERQLDHVVSELSKVVSLNSSFKSSMNENQKSKYLDYNAMLRDYQLKCLKLKELEEKLHNDENRKQVAVLEDKIKVLNEKLLSRSQVQKENEIELKDFYSKQLDDLKNTLSEYKLEVSKKEDEVNKLRANIDALKLELDLKNKSVLDKTEVLETAKSQNEQLSSQNESLKRKLNDHMDQLRTLKKENQLLVDRENTHLTEFRNYSRETDLKLKKMELALKQAQLERDKPKSEPRPEPASKAEMMLKDELMTQFSEVKQLLMALERSKKEQQQNNNLILTLRHQNDTAMSALREENKSALNSFAERNNSTLNDLKQENASLVSSVTESVNKLLEMVNSRSDDLLSQLKSQFDSLKEEMKSVESDKFVNQTTTPAPNLEEEGKVESSDQSLVEKYNGLKESFKATTTSLLKKEKILLDSLKKTVLECHTYKVKLEELSSGSGSGPQKCKCRAVVKRAEDGRRAKGCWCRLKNFSNLRQAVAKKAMLCESALLDSVEKPKQKRRTRHSEPLTT